VNEHNSAAANKIDPNLENLEQRLHRLENAVASLQDTRALEERVAERVHHRLSSGPAAALATDDRIKDANRRLPSVVPTVNRANAVSGIAGDVSLTLARRRWLIVDFWAELVAIVRMFFNVRYHVAWYARLAVLVLVPAILTSDWWLPVPNILGLRWIADKLVDLLLAFFLYKTLSREAHRYQEWKAQQRR
jgi:hypothetical protein